MSQATIYLKQGKDESARRFHPWIFSGAIASIKGKPDEGDLVEVYAADRTLLGIGHYQIGSIAVRLLSFGPAVIDHAFWCERIRTAYELRRALKLADVPDNDTYRLAYGEGDRLPGLIVDIYGSTAVVQPHTVGMYRARIEIAEAVKEVMGSRIRQIYCKSEGTLPFNASIEHENEYLYRAGNDNDQTAIEKGLMFQVDWQKGQKTGFFIDQRDSRLLLEQYAEGRRVANICSYTGGFSIYALRGRAALVHSVDSSARANAMTDRNVALNFPNDPRHRTVTADAFDFLAETDPDAYDLIILDPPAFAKHKNVLRNALIGYRKLNAAALAKIAPGGILFTFSCSQAVSRNEFRLAVFSAAAQCGRQVRILHQLTQPADHPVNIYHPEGEYLKGLVLHVE